MADRYGGLEFVAITQWILGIKPDYNGLTIDPCIPSGWDGFKVTRRFRNAVYNIVIKNPTHISKGVKRLFVDGKEFIGNLVPVFEDGKEHFVEVEMGND